MPIETLVFYGALVLWAALLLQGMRNSKWQGFTFFGVGLMLVLNIGYFVRGQGDAIAYFVSIYDLLDNAGVSTTGELPTALATCQDNACSIADNAIFNDSRQDVIFASAQQMGTRSSIHDEEPRSAAIGRHETRESVRKPHR